MKTQKNTKHKRILIAVGFQPYPTLFGGAVDVWERVIGLKKLGHEVDMVFTEKVAPTEEDLKLMKQFVSNIYFVKRKNHWKTNGFDHILCSFLSFRCLQFLFFLQSP